MNKWKRRPSGYCVENVFRASPHINSSFGGQSNGDNAGIFWFVFFSLNVFSRMEASQTTQASYNGETAFSSLSSLSASALGQSHFKH